ncbi:hypothetical protein ACFLXY_02445 [Chloroflexota bacterium]
MNLSLEMKKALVDEIKFVLKNMRSTNVASQKWYFFSAVHAVAQRIVNLEYDPELIFINQVFQLTYNMVNARLNAMSTGQEGVVGVPDNLFQKVEGEIEKLISLLEENQVSYPVLERLINIAYCTTGNGYYLYIKGMLKI